MESLSKGFCAGALTGSFAEADMVQWKLRWPRPTLQIIDIQRYPRMVTPNSPPSRFYAAVSDSVSLMWLIVPPATEMEDMVARYQLDVGCCVTLLEYSIVTAANGLNTIVMLRTSFSSNPLSLLGHPTYDCSLFQLSDRALTSHNTAAANSTTAGPSLHAPSREIVLRDLLDSPECAVNSWWIALRVLWRGQEHPTSRGRSDIPQSTRNMFQFVGADVNGDAILCSVWAGSSTPVVELSACLRIGHGSVVWGAGEVGLPLQLQFNSRSFIENIPIDQSASLPLLMSRPVGVLGVGLSTVKHVSEMSEIDDVVSICGTVRSIDPGVYVNTKRGRVLRLVVTLEDTAVPNVCIDVTMWGELAELIAPSPGERWFFSNCSVREFMRRKNLSSRSSTTALQISPTSDSERPLLTGLPPPPPPQQEAEATVAQSEDKRAAAVEATLHFVLSLHEASQTLPALARVQNIVAPIVKRVCLHCHNHFPRVHTEERCPVCSGTQWRECVQMTMDLSDGVDSIRAVSYTAVGEALLEMPESEFLSRSLECPSLESRLVERLIGLPILVWLLRHGGGGGEEAEGTATIVNCKHINLGLCASILLSTIEEMM